MDVATDKVNLAHDSQHADDVRQLSAALRMHFQGDH
jgi:hypothetical protein